MTAIEDGDDPKMAARKRTWIGAEHPFVAWDHDDDDDESAAIEATVESMVTMEHVWFLVSSHGGDVEEISLCRRLM